MNWDEGWGDSEREGHHGDVDNVNMFFFVFGSLSILLFVQIQILVLYNIGRLKSSAWVVQIGVTFIVTVVSSYHYFLLTQWW